MCSFVAALRGTGGLFILFFFFRYTRLLVGLGANWLYKPVLPRDTPVFLKEDVTVIVPTVDPAGVNFKECIYSILENDPHEVIIVTAGQDKNGTTNFEILEQDWKGYLAIRLMRCELMNKRRQLCTALRTRIIQLTKSRALQVKTPVTIFCDDHVFWPDALLPLILAPFSDAAVGIVGTAKRVRRTIFSFSLAAFCNVLGCLYLEQHNFDIRATNTVDGGCFVISSRTVALRTEVVQTSDFLWGFANEKTFFGLLGPLNADDDNFVTRWMVNHGWKIAWQDADGACVETTIGDDEGGATKLLNQNLRWMRSRWRSNATSLFSDRAVWRVQPWCVYAVYITSFVNFALFYDTCLIYTLWIATEEIRVTARWVWMSALLLWIFSSKIVKTAGYWSRNPRDLIYLPACILFGYFHSLIKLYALFTFWKIGWGSRKLSDEKIGAGQTRNTCWEDTVSAALIEKPRGSAAKAAANGEYTDSGYASAAD